MRNYLREAIREEVRRELRHELRRNGAGPPEGREAGQGRDGQRRDGRDGDGAGGRRMAEAEFRVMLRPIASSLPLGFFAFTTGTVLLTAIELKWSPAATIPQIAVLVLAFVVPLEALSGLFAFLARDSGAATGLTALSAAWAATAVTLLHGPPGALSRPLAIFLMVLALVMFVLSAPALSGKPLFGILLIIGGCRFALTGVYQAAGITGVEQTAGWLGVPLAVFALYGGLALLLEESFQRMVLPIGRRGRARSSLEGGFEHQVHQAELEPGVRRQL
jgi:succinate-acetate transporter protein